MILEAAVHPLPKLFFLALSAALLIVYNPFLSNGWDSIRKWEPAIRDWKPYLLFLAATTFWIDLLSVVENTAC